MGTGNGTITVFYTGSAGTVQYKVDSGSLVNVPSNTSPFVIPNIPAGPHTVTLQDSSGPTCAVTSPSVTVTTATPPTATLSGSTSLCLGDRLTLTANVTAGTAPFVYTWTGPNGFYQSSPNPTISIPSVGLANAGVYTVVVVDANYCSPTNPVMTTVTITPCANLQIVKCSDRVKIDKNGCVTFTIVVKNSGTGQARNVTVTDVLPECLALIKACNDDGWQISTDGQEVIATLPVLNAGCVAKFTITAKAQCCPGKTLTNSANVSSLGTEPVTTEVTICLKSKKKKHDK